MTEKDDDITSETDTSETDIGVGDGAVADGPADARPVPRSKSARKRSAAQPAAGSGGEQADESDEPVTVAESPKPAAAPRAVAGKRSREISITLSLRSVLRALGALAVIAVLVGVGVLGWAYHRDQQRLAAFDDAKSVSEEFVTRLVTTINPGNADKYKEILGPLSTGDLRQRLEQDRADTERNTEALAIAATSKILSSSVTSVDRDSATTTVMAEVTGRSAQVPAGETRLMIFVLDLRNVDGSWLVAEFSGPPGSTRSGVVDPSQSLPGQTGQAGAGAAPTSTAGAPTPTETAPAP
ncbi:MAG: hypothetical protein QM662_00910 [Gordonia sp. (in: high G+C Gram-positive bacteria)]